MLYQLFFFLIEFAIPFVIHGLLFFLFLRFNYLKGACTPSRYLSSSRNCSKEKLTSFRLFFSKDSQSVFNRSFLKKLLLTFLNDLLNVTLFGSFSKILRVIKNCAWWFEMSIIRFPEIVASLISLRDMLSISVFDPDTGWERYIRYNTVYIIFRNSAVSWFDS